MAEHQESAVSSKGTKMSDETRICRTWLIGFHGHGLWSFVSVHDKGAAGVVFFKIAPIDMRWMYSRQLSNRWH